MSAEGCNSVGCRDVLPSCVVASRTRTGIATADFVARLLPPQPPTCRPRMLRSNTPLPRCLFTFSADRKPRIKKHEQEH